MPVATVISLIISNLPALIKAGQAVWDLVNDVRAAARQSNTWDAAAQAKYNELILILANSPEQQPDAKN